MSHKPELPVEVVEQINTFVNEKTNAEREYWNKAVADPERFKTYMSGYESGVYVGATAYTTQLYQLQQENAELRRQNDKLKQQAEGWRPLLEDILREEQNGYVDISEMLQKRIKTFLYGE